MSLPLIPQCRIACFLVGSLFIASFAACGSKTGYQTTPVSGVVTCDGQPVANATINFTPVGGEDRAEGRRGRVALGMTDKDGRFTLTTYKNYDGAIVGRHTVTISANMDESTGQVPQLACKDDSLEIEVTTDISEYKVEF